MYALLIAALLSVTPTVRKPIYVDATTGWSRQMLPNTDAPEFPCVYFQDQTTAIQDLTVPVCRDSSGNMSFTDAFVGPLLLKNLQSVTQALNAAQASSVTATTTYTTTVSQSITVDGRTRVFVIGVATCSNTGSPSSNFVRVVQGTTAIGSTGGMSWDGGTLAATGRPQSATVAALTSTLTAGTYTFAVQVEAPNGTAQCRPATAPEGSQIYVFELNF